MRLRLTVERHRMPVVKLLFSIPAGELSISQLVELVNDAVPLETDQYGLEDYVVLLEGYECLHHQDTHAVLEDRDQVEIRPLSASEIKTRATSGRRQVSASGSLLIDGVVFRRSSTVTLQTPSTRMPPIKKRRTTTWDTAKDGKVSLPDFDPASPALSNMDNNPGSSSDGAHSAELGLSTVNGRAHDDYENDIDANDRKDCETAAGALRRSTTLLRPQDGKGSAMTPSSPSSMDSLSSSSSSSSTSSLSSSSGLSASDASIAHGDSVGAESLSRTRALSPAEGSMSSRPESSKVRHHVLQVVDPEGTHSPCAGNAAGLDTTAYGKGKRATQKRNRRRREARRRDFLERSRAAAIDRAASDLDLDSLQQATTGATVITHSSDKPSTKCASLDAKRKRLLDAMGLTASAPTSEGEAFTTVELGKAYDQQNSQVAADDSSNHPEAYYQSVSVSWHDKIEVSAVECVDHGVNLSTPPYPFKQRWDPQYVYRGKRGKKRKRREPELDHIEADSGTNPGLGFFQSSSNEEADSGDHYQDSSYIIRSSVDREHVLHIPIPPSDVTTLPVLQSDHLVFGAVVLFRQFEVSSSTGWQPGYSQHKTAIVKDFDETTAQLKAQIVHHQPVERDEQGHRIYHGLEMPVQDGNEHGEDLVEMAISELIDARLLKAAESTGEYIIDTFAASPEPRTVMDSVDPRSSTRGRATSFLNDECSSSRTTNAHGMSQATSEASINPATQDQAAQVRGSMLLHGISNTANRGDASTMSLEALSAPATAFGTRD